MVEITSIDTVEFGKAATLECNVIAMRGITSNVTIAWVTIAGLDYTFLRTVENVTANIVNNSAVYTDQLVIPPLSVNDSGRIYYCEFIYNATIEFATIVLDFTGT